MDEAHDKIIFRNAGGGIGDALLAFHIPTLNLQQGKDVRIQVQRKWADAFFPFCPESKDFFCFEDLDNSLWVKNNIVLDAYPAFGKQIKTGKIRGHYYQVIQRLLGFKPQSKPRCVFNSGLQKEKRKVCIAFDCSGYEQNQKWIHPRARELYPEHRETIQRFIKNNKNKYEFVEIGVKSAGFDYTQNKTSLPLEDSIRELSTCELYLGMNSGLMHVAAAFDIKSIVIINFPCPKRMKLPYEKGVYLEDIEWLYPQNIHLHEDGGGGYAPYLSYDNVEKAFNGEIYPHKVELDGERCETCSLFCSETQGHWG